MIYRIFLLLSWMISLNAEPIKKNASVVIVGEGVAGMSAALQLAQAGLKPLVILGPSPGGIITVSSEIENWPGDFSISGPHLVGRLEEQIEKRGAQLLPAVVTQVDFSKRPLMIYAKNPFAKDQSFEIETECCILALGASPNLLKVPGETDLLYRKIFTCAPCDGLQFKDQTVAVIGGGESALVEAHYLSHLAQKVVVIVRGKDFKSFQPALKDKLLSKPNVEVLYHTVVEQIKDDPDGIQLKLKKDASSETLLVQGAFLAIGSTPNTQILKGAVELDSEGYIILKEGQATSVPGVFAAGDVSDRIYKQAITAAGDATKAAFQAIHFLSTTSPSIASVKNPEHSEMADISDLSSFQKAIQSSSLTVAYFYSPFCLPCRNFKHTYAQWAQNYNAIATFLKINLETCSACFETYKIKALPTVLILDDQGEILKSATGLSRVSELETFLKNRLKRTRKSTES